MPISYGVLQRHIIHAKDYREERRLFAFLPPSSANGSNSIIGQSGRRRCRGLFRLLAQRHSAEHPNSKHVKPAVGEIKQVRVYGGRNDGLDD